MIDVVSGVMIRDGRVFFTQRRADQSYPFMFESPGGKVEEGEDLRAALVRELGEELRFQVSYRGPRLFPKLGVALEPFFVTEFNRGVVDGVGEERSVRISFFLVTIEGGNVSNEPIWPVGAEGQGSGWFDIPALRALRMLPGNERARLLLEREIVREGARK